MRRTFALAALLLLSACGAVSIQAMHQPGPVVWSSMVYAAMDGPMLVDVVGLPPPAAPRVAARMTGAVFGYPVSFTADPRTAPRPNFRVVMVFQPPPGLDEHAVCAGQAAVIAGAPPDRTSLFAAFCSRDRSLSWARGSAAGVPDPDHPGVADLIRQATRGLFGSPPRERMGMEIMLP